MSPLTYNALYIIVVLAVDEPGGASVSTGFEAWIGREEESSQRILATTASATRTGIQLVLLVVMRPGPSLQGNRFKCFAFA